MRFFSAVIDFTGQPRALGRLASPLIETANRRPLTAIVDSRLDNRIKLAQALGIDRLPEDDAQLILAAYAHWGESCLKHLLGDFSFAIWDQSLNRVFCARDPLGVRPFCWARSGERLWIASEARLILADPAISPTLDEHTISSYLAGLTEDPDRTFFRNVHRLPPGHFMMVTPSGWRQEPYWDLGNTGAIFYKRKNQYAEHFREILDCAVQDRVQTEASTVGIAMSGGLDSCSIAAFARRNSRSRGPVPFACSLVFDELTECDERALIGDAAEAFEIDVSYIKADSHWFLSDPYLFRPTLESPFLTWESSFTEMLARARERGARVLLTGHGADDLLRGSSHVYADRIRKGDPRAIGEILLYAGQQWQNCWTILHHYLGAPLLPLALKRILRRLKGKKPHMPSPPAWIQKNLASRSGLLDRWAVLNSEQRCRRGASAEILESLRSLPGDRSLAWFDRHAASFGIEVRHPFFDQRLVEFVAAIPPSELFEAGSYKPLLRRAMKGLLPESIRQRQKKARFGRLVDLGLVVKETQRVSNLFKSPIAADMGFIDKEALQDAYKRYLFTCDPTDSERALWYPLTLEIWLREHAQSLGLGHLLETDTQPTNSTQTTLTQSG